MIFEILKILIAGVISAGMLGFAGLGVIISLVTFKTLFEKLIEDNSFFNKLEKIVTALGISASIALVLFGLIAYLYWIYWPTIEWILAR